MQKLGSFLSFKNTFGFRLSSRLLMRTHCAGVAAALLYLRICICEAFLILKMSLQWIYYSTFACTDWTHLRVSVVSRFCEETSISQQFGLWPKAKWLKYDNCWRLKTWTQVWVQYIHVFQTNIRTKSTISSKVSDELLMCSALLVKTLRKFMRNVAILSVNFQKTNIKCFYLHSFI